MTGPSMREEYEYAIANETPAALAFRDLARLYMRHQDAPTLGLLTAAAADVRREMRDSR